MCEHSFTFYRSCEILRLFQVQQVFELKVCLLASLFSAVFSVTNLTPTDTTPLSLESGHGSTPNSKTRKKCRMPSWPRFINRFWQYLIFCYIINWLHSANFVDFKPPGSLQTQQRKTEKWKTYCLLPWLWFSATYCWEVHHIDVLSINWVSKVLT